MTDPGGGMVPGPVERHPSAIVGSMGAASVGGVRNAGGLVRSTLSRARLPEDRFDAVIVNVPFAALKLDDRR